MRQPGHGLPRVVALTLIVILAGCGAPAPASPPRLEGGPRPPRSGLAVPKARVSGEPAMAADAAVPVPPAEGATSVASPAASGGLAGAAHAVAPHPERAATPLPPLPDFPLDGPIAIAIDPSLTPAWSAAVGQRLAGVSAVSDGDDTQPLSVANSPAQATTLISVGGPNAPGAPIAERYFAVVTPFDTVRDEIALEEVIERWQGASAVFTTEEGWNLLPALLGEAAETTTSIAPQAMIGQLDADRDAIGILPFDQLDPRFKVLTVDGVNVLSNQLQTGQYPLATQLKVSGNGAAAVADLLRGSVEPATNRDPSALTTLVMTGVTAMARGTADAIVRANDNAYPARVIGPELALADITHVSNEIPFIEGCVVENFEDNLVLCSDPDYWEALEFMGADIIGLSGNHVNDFGRDGARESLQWYRQNRIPIYGSGLTVDEACAPLLWEQNGNTFAFVAALAYGPESAWVTDEEPGACYYYEHKERILDTVRTLANAVDVVAVELQYEETYFPSPTDAQVSEFRELRAAGADLVTGVQSHVPQAQEPYGRFDAGGPGMISYGLGNLFFDQMWSWETRTELYDRHTIYDGEIISTEILTGILEDYAQPRWATPEERADLLQTIFDGAPPRP